MPNRASPHPCLTAILHVSPILLLLSSVGCSVTGFVIGTVTDVTSSEGLPLAAIDSTWRAGDRTTLNLWDERILTGTFEGIETLKAKASDLTDSARIAILLPRYVFPESLVYLHNFRGPDHRAIRLRFRGKSLVVPLEQVRYAQRRGVRSYGKWIGLGLGVAVDAAIIIAVSLYVRNIDISQLWPRVIFPSSP